MSKKDFEAIAEAMLSSKPKPTSKAAMAQWEKDVEALARVCGGQIPRFDHGRFVRAAFFQRKKEHASTNQPVEPIE